MRAIFLALLVILAKPVPLTSVKFWNEYRASESAADKKYLGKEVVLKGKIVEISAQYTMYLEGGPGAVSGVTAVPTTDQYQGVGQLKVGNIVTVACINLGLVFNEPIVRECRLR